MDPLLFARGIALGFAIAAPVGPIGILVIRRTLASGRLVGFVSGMGAATADACYGSLAAFGLTALSGTLVGHSAWIRLAGGAFLCYLGVTIALARPPDGATPAPHRGLYRAFGSTLLLTLTNPATILSFVAVFAGLGLIGSPGSYLSATVLVVGVFTGSGLWWAVLTIGVGALRRRLSGQGMRWIDRLAGGVLSLFGLLSVASAVSALRRSLVS